MKFESRWQPFAEATDDIRAHARIMQPRLGGSLYQSAVISREQLLIVQYEGVGGSRPEHFALLPLAPLS
jgi:hypothetical protein